MCRCGANTTGRCRDCKRQDRLDDYGEDVPYGWASDDQEVSDE